MKANLFALSFLIVLFSSRVSFGQSDSLGMLGDQLDLYGVLDLFKNSDNLEEFERKLNSEDNEVNNLDLNNDDQIDYIRVTDYKEGNGHAIVLQVPINESESQDVAVIEVDQTADNVAHVQIVGDEDLYGKNYIVEPLDDTPSSTTVNNNTIVVVNTWSWRPVRYFYGPTYRAWVSPWRWSYYPGWFRPWRPVGWHVYHPRVVRYRPYARVVVVRRSPRIYNAVYAPRRVTSKVVLTNRTRPNYYNPSPAPKTGTGTNAGRNNANSGRQNKQGTGNKVNHAQPKRQQSNPNVNAPAEQRRTRKEHSAEPHPSNGGGKRQHMREGAGGGHRQQHGSGGKGRRVR